MSLAIIIPAYKPLYLKKAIESVCNQTDQRFTCYIGDDNSPFELEKIVTPFLSRKNIIYKKFDKNLGEVSLTKQWQRCVDLSENEEWIWIFADDDLMEAQCVENFYSSLEYYQDKKLFRFNKKVIDEKDNIIIIPDQHPIEESFESFFYRRITFQSYSGISEYIFHRDLYSKYGLIDFPLAWCSDDATWMQYLNTNSVITINHTFVSWRLSGSNISSESKIFIDQKSKAVQQYILWLKNHQQYSKLLYKYKNHIIKWFYTLEAKSDKSVGWKKDYSFLKKIAWTLNRIFSFSENIGYIRSLKSIYFLIYIFSVNSIFIISTTFLKIVFFKD